VGQVIKTLCGSVAATLPLGGQNATEPRLKPHTWEFTLVLVEMLNRKTASFEHKNRPHQEMSLTRKDTGELHMPAKRIATEAQRKKSSGSKYSSEYFAARRAPRVSGKVASHNSNGINVKSERRYQAPVVTSNHGCQSPNTSLLLPPAARLVGVELNPGPVGRQAKGKKAQQKKSANQPRKAGKRRSRAMKGPGPSSIRASTGRLGLSMTSGTAPGSVNRRQKICEEDEFIANVSGSSTTSAFTISNTIAVNPGLLASFPWLAGEASRYNEYEWEMLEFYFKRTVSEFATAGTTGKVLLFFDPDAADVPPTTKQQIEDSVFHNDGMPCDPVIRLPIDCARLRRNLSKYVRVGPAPANTDLKTYDAGVLYAACDSTATSGVVGELRVRYRIKFTVPVLTAADVSLSNSVVHFSSIAATTANNFAGAVQQAGATLLGVVLGANTVTFPAGVPGNYFVSFAVAGATSASNSGGITATAGASSLSLLTQSAVRDATSQVVSLSGTTTSPAMLNGTYSIAATGGLLSFGASTIVGAGSMDLWLFVLPSTVLTVDEREQVEIDDLRLRADRQDAKIERLMALLSGASTPMVMEEDEQKSSDELGSSVHIPRAMLARFLRSDETFLPPGKVAAK
jgi:hypothetical protein